MSNKEKSPQQPKSPDKAGLGKQDGGQCQMVWLFSRSKSLSVRIERALSGEPVRILAMRMTLPLELADGARPRVAILDVDNDLAQGGLCVEELQRRLRGVPIVVFTNNLSHDFGIQIISRGIQYFFEYDFNATEFVEVIRNLLARPMLH